MRDFVKTKQNVQQFFAFFFRVTDAKFRGKGENFSNFFTNGMQNNVNFSAKNAKFSLNNFPISLRLRTKDETLETAVVNFYCLFPYIYDFLQL